MSWLRVIAGSLVVLLMASIAEAKETRPKLLVPGLVAERGVEEAIVRLLNELLLSEFARAGTYEVVGVSDIQAAISAEQMRQLAGCSSTDCLADIGGALGAEFVVFANIGRMGKYYLLNVKVLDSHSGDVVERWSERVPNIEDQLMDAVVKSVAAVTGKGKEGGAASGGADTEVASAGQPEAKVVESTGESRFGVVPWIIAGVAVASAAVGLGFGLKAQSDMQYYPFDSRYAAAKSDAETSAIISSIGFGVAGAGLATAAILLIIDWTSDSAGDRGAVVVPAVSADAAYLIFDLNF